MRIASLLLPVLALAAVAGSSAPPAQAAADPRTVVSGTQCRAGERVAFTCAMGRKVVSVCIQPNRLVAYRYGPLGKPEMVIASSGADGRAHRGEVMLSGGGAQQHLRFHNAGAEYVVYSGITGPGFDPPNVRSSGLVVLRGQDEVSSRACPRNGLLQRIPYEDTRFIAQDPDDTDTEY
jgi:hypothetical protein